MVAPDTITITGLIKSLELAADEYPDQQAPLVPWLSRQCGPEEHSYRTAKQLISRAFLQLENADTVNSTIQLSGKSWTSLDHPL